MAHADANTGAGVGSHAHDAHGHGGAHDGHNHPGPKLYTQIAVVLGVITIAEVAVVYIAALHGILVPLLLGLSAVKFALVVMYYMHLKFDPKIYTGLICSGLAIAGAVFLGLAALMHNNGFLP